MTAHDPGNRNDGPGKGDRAERLAAALKQNLKRRKAQARGRAEAGQERSEGPSAETPGTEKNGENQ